LCTYDEAHLYVDVSCVDGWGCYGPLGGGQAASPTAKCKQAAIQATTLSGTSFDPTTYNFIAGNNKKNDNFTSKNTQGKDVFCGFGGNDEIATLDADDIFIGGAGGDAVAGGANYGIIYGGDGRDGASYNYGTVYGDAGDDGVQYNYGTFDGGDGSEFVEYNYAGATFNGDAGDDTVDYNYGTFNGGDGNDTVTYPNESTGTFVD
jgi:Ca2+-binding RTX toxin-like protein